MRMKKGLLVSLVLLLFVGMIVDASFYTYGLDGYSNESLDLIENEETDEAEDESNQEECIETEDNIEDEDAQLMATGLHFSGGDGSQENPYLISSADAFNDIRQFADYEGIYFALTQNIDMSSYPDFEIIEQFRGTLDGRNFALNNITINGKTETKDDKTYTYAGIFKYNYGNIKNLIINNPSINISDVTAYIYVGTLATQNKNDKSIIENISIDNLKIDYNYNLPAYVYIYDITTIGGLIGIGNCQIINCTCDGSITVNKNDSEKVNSLYVGGIIAYATGDITKVEDSVANCDIDVTDVGYGRIGGIVGCTPGDIIRCSNKGDICIKETSDAYIGGISGEHSGISECSNSGNIIVDNSKCHYGESSYIGGILGCRGSITNCNNSGDIKYDGNPEYIDSKVVYLGGNVGYTGSSITNCINTGNCSISCVDGPINGKLYEGGIVGCNYGSTKRPSLGINTVTINACSNYGKISGESSIAGSSVGGIVGDTENYIRIRKCFNVGDICNLDDPCIRYSGGIIGGEAYEITNCFNLGIVKSNSVIGHAAGISPKSTSQIYDCYNLGEIVGPYAQEIDGNSANESGCYTREEMKNIQAGSIEKYSKLDQEIWEIATNYLYPSLIDNPINTSDVDYYIDEDELIIPVLEEKKISAVFNKTVPIEDVLITCDDKSTLLVRDNNVVKGLKKGSVDIIAKSIYGGIEKHYTIEIKDSIENARVEDIGDVVYDGSEKKPKVQVTLDGKKLAEDVDYSISYSDNINVGKATAKIKGKGEYVGTIVKEFTITKADQNIEFEEDSIKVSIGKTHNIKLANPEDVYGNITYKVENNKYATVNSSGVIKGVKAGSTKIIVKAAGDKNHNEAKATVNVIVPTAITKAVLTKTSYTYNGEVQKPDIKSVNGSTKLQPDTDYTVEYKDSSNNECNSPIVAGTYKVVITGIGKYDGTVTKSFTIAKAANTVTTEATATTIYVGKKKAEITASAKEYAGITYSLDKTSKKYVSIVDDGNGKATLTALKAGTAKVTVTSAATDNYKATSKTISITVKNPTDVSASKVTSVGTAVWNGGEEINPAVTVKSGKTTFQAGTDYKIRYELVNTGEGTDDDWDVGDTVKVTVDATDEDAFACKGTIVKNVVITKASQTATATAPSTIYYGEGKEPVQIDVDNIPSTYGDTNPNVTYKSSSTKIATVSDDGKITPIKAGKVTITVNIGETTHYSAKSIKLTVNVKAATKLTSKNVKITAAYNDGKNVVPAVIVTGFKKDIDYIVDYDNSGINDIGHKITVTVIAVAESGGCLGTYEKEVVVGKGEQSITIDNQPTTVKVKATTPTFTIVGVKDDADVSVTTKTYAKMKDLGEDQDGNNQYAITGIKKGTATVTVKIAGTDKYNSKTLTFKVKVTK